MTKVALYAPELGEGIESLKIIEVLKNKGEKVKLDEPLVRVETSKSSMDIESPATGYIESLHFQVNDNIKVGELLLTIDTDCSNTGVIPADHQIHTGIAGNISPHILGYCQRNNISLETLANIKGSGKNDCLTIEDVMKATKLSPEHTAFHFASLAPAWIINEADLEEEAKTYTEQDIPPAQLRLNKAMQKSLSEIPQASISLSVKLPKNPLIPVIRAIENSCRKFDKLRAELVNEARLRIHNHLAIGIAIALPEDGLTTIVLDDTQTLSDDEIELYIKNKTQKYRKQPDNLPFVPRHSVTVSDMSTFGIEQAVPFVVFPAVATIFIGAPTPNGFSNLTLSFDHRVMNGVYASRILRKIQVSLSSGV